MFEPPAPASSPEELIAWQVDAIHAELARIDSRLRALGWGASVSARRVAETWAEISLGIPDDGQADGDQVAREALLGKRARLLFELGQLRQRLTGQAAGTRRGGWG